MEGGSAWADILNALSEKRSSIEAATNFALERPSQAAELFAAIIAQLQVRGHGPGLVRSGVACKTGARMRD